MDNEDLKDIATVLEEIRGNVRTAARNELSGRQRMLLGGLLALVSACSQWAKQVAENWDDPDPMQVEIDTD